MMGGVGYITKHVNKSAALELDASMHHLCPVSDGSYPVQVVSYPALFNNSRCMYPGKYVFILAYL